MKKILILFLIAIISNSCKRIKVVPIVVSTEPQFTYIDNYLFILDDACKDSVEELPEINSGYQFVEDPTNVRYASFNPNNPNEIIYYRDNYVIGGTNEVLIYDRTLQSSKVLANLKLNSPPKWGKNGWILLSSNGVYKIKENGDSLGLIASGTYPEWNYTSTKFVCTSPGTSNGYIYDFLNNTTENLSFHIGYGPAWQNQKNLMVHFPTDQVMQGFNLGDMNVKTNKRILYQMSSHLPCWLNDSEFVYTQDDKLKILNIENYTISTIAKFCANDHGHFLSYSQISNELMMPVEHWKSIGPELVEISGRIMVLNFNTYTVSYFNP